MSVTSVPAPALRQRRRFSYRKSSSYDPTKLRDPSKERPTSREETARVVGDPTLREFLRVWERKIERTIERMHLGDHVADIKQEIFLFMSQRNSQGKTGLEAYDTRKGAFSSYLYRLVILKACNYRNKLKRDRLVLGPSDFDLDRHSPDPEERSQRADFYLHLARIKEDFDVSVNDSDGGFFDEDGKLVTRDLRTVLELLMEGHTRQELVRLLHCSVPEVDRLIETLRSHGELRRLLDQEEATPHVIGKETEMPRGYPGTGKAAKKKIEVEDATAERKKPGPKKGYKRKVVVSSNGATNGHGDPMTAKEKLAGVVCDLSVLVGSTRDTVSFWGISSLAEKGQVLFDALARFNEEVALVPDDFKPLPIEQARLIGASSRIRLDALRMYPKNFSDLVLKVVEIHDGMATCETSAERIVCIYAEHLERADFVPTGDETGVETTAQA